MAALSPLHVPGCARLGIARLNAFRLNVYEAVASVIVGGAEHGQHFRIEGATIQQVLNDAPDTAGFRTSGFVPVAGQPIRVTMGNATVPIFGGRVLETTVLYESRHQNVAYDLRGIDPTWLLNRQRVLTRYDGLSASAIVLDLVARFTRGVTTTNVVAGLPVIPAISFQNETVATCLTAVCERIGGYWYLDYDGDLHVFLNEATVANPITDANPHGSRDHTLSEDLSQVVTRVIARGAGVGAAIDLAAGSSELPVDLGDTPSMYNPAGGIAEVGSDRIAYTAVRGLGGIGALVGTGNAPTDKPHLWRATGVSHVVGGVYQYAYTYVTAAGETSPGPTQAWTVPGDVAPAPPSQPARSTGTPGAGSGMVPGGTYRWAIQFHYAGGGYGPIGAKTPASVVDSNTWEIAIPLPQAPADGVWYYPAWGGVPLAEILHTNIYRTTNGGTTLYLERQYAGAPASGSGYVLCSNNVSDAALVGQPQPPAASAFSSVDVRSLPGSAGGLHAAVTKLRIYRTALNGSVLKRVTELTVPYPASNYVDQVADAALGVTAPTGDTSGITENVQVPAGATELPVSSTVPFETDGPERMGFVRIGNLVVWHQDIAAGKLTGIPASGQGSITATLRYGAQVLVQPRLFGVTGLAHAVRKGDTVAIRIEVEDTAAQNALATRLGGVPADGIVEEPFSDATMTLTELQDYARALLADRKDPKRTVRFESRDLSLQVGRLITITLTQPPISGTFRIQRMTFSEIAITGGLNRVQPLLAVEASNKLYTFADLLRRLRGREGGAG